MRANLFLVMSCVVLTLFEVPAKAEEKFGPFIAERIFYPGDPIDETSIAQRTAGYCGLKQGLRYAKKEISAGSIIDENNTTLQKPHSPLYLGTGPVLTILVDPPDAPALSLQRCGDVTGMKVVVVDKEKGLAPLAGGSMLSAAPRGGKCVVNLLMSSRDDATKVAAARDEGASLRVVSQENR